MKKVKLEEICEIVTGTTPAKKQEEYWNKKEVPFITPAELKYEGINYIEPQNFVSKKGAETGRIIPENSIIVCCIGSIGKLGINKQEIITNQQINSIILKENNVDLFYLYFYLKFSRKRMEKMASSTTVKIINKSSFGKLEIELPDLITQIKIGKLLKNLSEIIEIKNKKLSELEKLSKCLFVKMIKENPEKENWKYKKIFEVYQIIDGDRGKNYPKAEELYEDEYCLFLNTGNVTKNGFNLKKNFFITKEKDESLRKGKLERGDIVLTTRGTVGNIAYYDRSINYSNMRINSGMVILRNIEEINKDYFIAFFKEENSYMKLISGSAQPQLPISKLKELKILLPPMELQNQFAKRISVIEKSKVEVQKSIEETQKLFDSLMEKYFG